MKVCWNGYLGYEEMIRFWWLSGHLLFVQVVLGFLSVFAAWDMEEAKSIEFAIQLCMLRW